MVECRTITWDPSDIYPAALDRKTPAEARRIEWNTEADVDCAGAGNTVTNAVWALNPADDVDDTTITQQSITGYWVSALFSGGLDGKVYHPTVTVTTSDGRTLVYPAQVPIIETRLRTAA